jgi:hypothetical protein
VQQKMDSVQRSPCASTLVMEAVRSSETSVYSNETTRRRIPEDSNLHTRRRENLRPHAEEIVNVLNNDS